jgi:hypothetical protein
MLITIDNLESYKGLLIVRKYDRKSSLEFDFVYKYKIDILFVASFLALVSLSIKRIMKKA